MSTKHIKSLSGSIAAIVLLLGCNSTQGSVDADGVLEKGVRIISVPAEKIPDTLKVFRGNAVELLFEKSAVPVCSIPAIKNVVVTEKESRLSVSFTAADTGLFNVFGSDTKQVTLLKVMEYKSDGKTKLTNLSGKKAGEVLKDTSIFILDVRTPSEFSEGHIPRAEMVSVGELADKIETIEQYKNKPVFVYCRSGNRSIAAVQILTKRGFTNIYHLNGGIKSWIKEGLPIEK